MLQPVAMMRFFPPFQSNMLQVEIQLDVNRLLLALPAGLPGYETYNSSPGQHPEDINTGGCVLIHSPDLQLELRTHDYFMGTSLSQFVRKSL